MSSLVLSACGPAWQSLSRGRSEDAISRIFVIVGEDIGFEPALQDGRYVGEENHIVSLVGGFKYAPAVVYEGECGAIALGYFEAEV